MNDLRTAAQQALEALEWHLERGAYGADIEGVTGNLRAALAQQAEPAQELVAKMTAGRAVYFMERFKREEKLLGPNEQAALDFVISMLEQQAEPVEPVAYFGSAYVNENGVHITTVLGPVAIPQDAKLYTAPPQRTMVSLTSNKDRPDQGATYVEGYGYVDTRAVRAVEQASWEKNNGQA